MSIKDGDTVRTLAPITSWTTPQITVPAGSLVHVAAVLGEGEAFEIDLTVDEQHGVGTAKAAQVEAVQD